jgi:hypothetical protein
MCESEFYQNLSFYVAHDTKNFTCLYIAVFIFSKKIRNILLNFKKIKISPDLESKDNLVSENWIKLRIHSKSQQAHGPSCRPAHENAMISGSKLAQVSGGSELLMTWPHCMSSVRYSVSVCRSKAWTRSLEALPRNQVRGSHAAWLAAT